MASLIPNVAAKFGLGRGFVRVLGVALVVLSPPLASADPVDPATLQRFVRQDCGSCHGLTLMGGLGPEITPEAMQFYDRGVLTTVILDGIPDTPMPPWRPLLSLQEAEWIADYLLSGEMK